MASYVPPIGTSSRPGAPVTSGALTPQPSGGPPGGGPSLTVGIPDPGAIARQKDVYLKMLDEQLKQGVSVLDQQVKYQRDYLSVQCEQQKKQFLLQLDQQMKGQEMVLTQQYNEQLMALQMQAGTQKAALEQQSMQLAMEYEQRKAEEHMYRQQYEIQQQQQDMAAKIAQDYQRFAPPTPPPPLRPTDLPPYPQSPCMGPGLPPYGACSPMGSQPLQPRHSSSMPMHPPMYASYAPPVAAEQVPLTQHARPPTSYLPPRSYSPMTASHASYLQPCQQGPVRAASYTPDPVTSYRQAEPVTSYRQVEPGTAYRLVEPVTSYGPVEPVTSYRPEPTSYSREQPMTTGLAPNSYRTDGVVR